MANDIRGASAIKDAVRAARMLNQMTDQDAEAVGVPEHERTSYFRVDRVKGNNAPPAKAVWRRFVNVELPNTDEVGVVAPWDFPGQGAPSPEMTAAEQAADSVFMQLLVRLTMEGRTVSDKAGTNYAPHVFSQEREAKAARDRQATAGRCHAPAVRQQAHSRRAERAEGARGLLPSGRVMRTVCPPRAHRVRTHRPHTPSRTVRTAGRHRAQAGATGRLSGRIASHLPTHMFPSCTY